MKKLVAVIVVSLFLTACGTEQQQEIGAQEDDYVTEEVMQSTDGILETDYYTLEFKESEVIESDMENGTGVFLTFDLTNNSDNNIIPSDVLRTYVQVSQTTDTSLIHGEPYHYLDAFGVTSVSYNRMVDLSNSMSDELLPGATIEVVEAYSIEDDALPIKVTAFDYQDYTEEVMFETDI